ncbi:TolB-like 6-bladed beta-propeller domain-containing protein [Belliella sp. R4-6]|uniref:TolB-like 6-bladed beta-propeller domain-containing protein n=1 Tax=Belliella alkalica TaxID=1730871 RepID=A0ABS9V8J5_9BACT|nr:BF3164 family lipoprotein [Belliella alkalica]MCH7412744.1 TolB-like 6-bladed beta-propeller domain-containing protein [Belliella alkalica]
MKNYKNISLTILFFAFVLLPFLGCENTSDEQIYMTFDKVDYVIDFPNTFKLSESKTPQVDIVGLSDFTIFDSLLILGTKKSDGLWDLYSLPDYQPLGSFLKRGDGPEEFMQGPGASMKNKIVKESGQIIAYIYDFEKGSIKRFNISESIKSKELHLSTMEKILPPFLFDFVMLDSAEIFIREIGDFDTHQIRFIVNENNKKIEMPFLEKLNETAISKGKNINILSTIIKSSPLGNRLVEMPVFLNYINLYSPNGEFYKTICVGDKLFDISVVQEQEEWSWASHFSNVSVFDGFFGVVYHEEKRKKSPSILLFDLEGSPLAELELENHITSFDIDFNSMELYTFDSENDKFLKYNIQNVLSEIGLSKL